MSKVPVYQFLQRDAAQRLAPKTFVDALISTKRFFRDEKGNIRFKIDERDHMQVLRSMHLQQILQDGDVLEVIGDVDADMWRTLWLWATSRAHTFPRLNPEKPWNPDAPLGVRHVAPADRYRRGVDCA